MTKKSKKAMGKLRGLVGGMLVMGMLSFGHITVFAQDTSVTPTREDTSSVTQTESAKPEAESPGKTTPSTHKHPEVPTTEQKAPAEEEKPVKWYDNIQFNGFVSGSYSHNFNEPNSSTNQVRVFDFDDQAFKVDGVELVIQKPVSEIGDAGFRVDAMAGSSIPRNTSSLGLFWNDVNSNGVKDAGEGEDFDVHQAFASYIADVGNGLRFDIGKFITNNGAEVIPGYDVYNDNATSSFLFGYAIPFTHTGVRATYAFNDKVMAMAMVTNGWDNVKDNNRAKSFGGQLMFTPSSNFTLYLNYMGGPERNNNNNDVRNLFDVVAIWKPVNWLTLTGNYDNGSDENAIAQGRDARWDGTALYAKFDVSKKWALTLRHEWFNDRNGFRTGTTQKLNEWTFTPTYKVNDNFLLRADLRFDHSNQAVFEKRGSVFVNNQGTLFLNAIYLF